MGRKKLVNPSLDTVVPPSSNPSFRWAILLLVVIVAVAGALGLKNRLSSKDASLASNAQSVDVDPDIATLIADIRKHIVIDSEETPAVATVQDAALLRTQNPSFYKDVTNGDRLLIWSDKAVLYSPSKDVLLAVMPISVPAATSSSAPTTPTPTATSTIQAEAAVIEVRNGSDIPGRGKTMVEKLKAGGLTVLPATDAEVKTYTKTIIIRANDKPLPLTLQALVSLTGAEVVEPPPAETGLKGDFLVVVGSDSTTPTP